tara:strand:- start:2975 stop:4261 length:1287 start_codon:yes stop_codon:yes gene_type:complete
MQKKIQTILKRLLQLHPKSVDLSLSRIKRLLKDLKNPEKKIKNVIQVIGTNGKYSVCSTLREIFETAGYTVSMNISPSLKKFNERYYLSGNYISDKELYNLLIEVEKINKKQNITFHEFICACFFLAASRSKSDINILESGLFFRLDASNVLEKNIASIITPIGMDHKDFLKRGTIDEIIYEKCSALLNHSKIFICEQKKDILKKIEKTIVDNNSDKIIFGKNYYYKKTLNGFLYKDDKGEINLPKPNLVGDFQISNVSAAIATVRQLQQFKITDSHIKKSITKIRSEARLQKITKGKLLNYISKNNEILIDGAHNPLAALQIEKYLKNLNSGKKIIMVLGMMANKDHKEFIQIFKKRIHSIVTLNIPNQENFIAKSKLSEIARSCGIPSKTENSIQSALKNITSKNNNTIIFFTGSLYFAGEILKLN